MTFGGGPGFCDSKTTSAPLSSLGLRGNSDGITVAPPDVLWSTPAWNHRLPLQRGIIFVTEVLPAADAIVAEGHAGFGSVALFAVPIDEAVSWKL